MRATSVIGSIALTIVLFSTGCNRQRDNRPVVWIGNADLSDYNEVVADFSNAFASDPLCHGIRIETHDFPKEPLWFLEVSSTAPGAIAGSGPHDFSDGISWWMNHNQNKSIVKFEGSDGSSSAAAHHVCFIIRGQGGEIH
jgi:hypothetical protein